MSSALGHSFPRLVLRESSGDQQRSDRRKGDAVVVDECRGNEERFGRGVAAVTRDRAVPYAQAQQLANSDATAGVSSAKKEREKKVPSSKYLLAIK